jgi:DNA-directed RNA polymerase specialized sigma24 family protein
MPHTNPTLTTEQQVQLLIRRKARQLRRRPECRRESLEDLQQELWCRWLHRQCPADSVAPTPQQLARSLKQVIANLLRAHQAAKRRPHSLASLSEGAGWHTKNSREPSEEERSRHRACWTPPVQVQVDCQADLAAAMNVLSPAIVELASQLRHQSLSELARSLKIPRSTLVSRLRPLQQRCAELGLDDYLPRSSSFRERTG